MKTIAFAILGLLTVTACERREESARGAEGADTIITSEQTTDTAIVTTDTTVDVDTAKREGDRPVRRDTLQKTGPGRADTLQR